MGNEVRNCGNCKYKNVPTSICHTCIVTQKPRLPYWAAQDDVHPEEEVNAWLDNWEDDDDSNT